MRTHLTNEEHEVLERMKREWAEREAVPPEKSVPVPNSEKYAFPIGVDEDGKLLPVPDPESENEHTDPPSRPGDASEDE